MVHHNIFSSHARFYAMLFYMLCVFGLCLASLVVCVCDDDGLGQHSTQKMCVCFAIACSCWLHSMCVGLTIVWIGCAIGISRRDSYRALSVDQIIHKKHHIKVGAKRGHK